MSLRRFVAYFLAVTAGSTVAFASLTAGPPAPADVPPFAVSQEQMATRPTPTPVVSHPRRLKLARVAMAE